jgi:ubiquinone biosynthesis protein
MRVSSIPQIYRNVRRWQEIIRVLRRYGLADWLSKLNVDFIRDWIKDDSGTPLASYSREQRIRMAITELGPTFIKFGQVLSLRPDLVGLDLASELQALQSDIPADPPASIRKTLAEHMQGSIEQTFLDFDNQPIASASIGQVHRATLPDGTDVVVKIQHENIRETIREDLDVLSGLAVLAERLPELAAWQPQMLVEQLSRSIKKELSFSRELQNLQLFQTKLADFENLRIPTPYPQLSSSRVLVMEAIDGRSIGEAVERSPLSPPTPTGENGTPSDHRFRSQKTRPRNTDTFDGVDLARQISELYIEMIFRMGVYHADPHPGNIFVTKSGELALIDFGMVGRIDERLRETIEEMLLAVGARDASMLTSLIKRVGKMPPQLDENSLSLDVDELVSNYGAQPMDSFDLTGALNDVTEILHRHRITLPPQGALLIKTLITLQGTLKQLHPQFSLIEILEPTLKQLWLRRLSPARQIRRLRRVYVEVESLVEKLPSQINSVMELVRDGRLDVRLSHRGLGPSVNRLVLGLLTSSLFLGSSVLMAYKVPPLVFLNGGPFGMKDLSVLGLIGTIGSLMTGMRLLLAINQSGHLDPKAEEED